MKQLCLSIAFFLTFQCSYGQEIGANSKIVLTQFKKQFNAGQYDSIYHRLTDHAKTKLPLNEVNTFLTQLKSKLGNIDTLIFLKYQGNFDVYKTDFEKGRISLFISLEEKKLNGIYA
jgi:hypothetical protein